MADAISRTVAVYAVWLCEGRNNPRRRADREGRGSGGAADRVSGAPAFGASKSGKLPGD